MDMKMIGKSIAEARKKSSLTQEQLAEKLGVTTQAVSKWENGHNLPDIENLMQIAELTNTPYAVLLGEPDGPIENEHFFFRNRLFTRRAYITAFLKRRTTVDTIMLLCHICTCFL